MFPRFRSNNPLPDHEPLPHDPEFATLWARMLHTPNDGNDGQLAWTLLVEWDSQSKSHSVWEELVVTQRQLKTCWLPPLLYCPLWVTTVSIHDTPGLLVQALSVPPLSLGLLSAPQSLCTFHLTLAPLARCLFMQGPSWTHLRSWCIGLWTRWCFLTHCSHREAWWHS